MVEAVNMTEIDLARASIYAHDSVYAQKESESKKILNEKVKTLQDKLEIYSKLKEELLKYGTEKEIQEMEEKELHKIAENPAINEFINRLRELEDEISWNVSGTSKKPDYLSSLDNTGKTIYDNEKYDSSAYNNKIDGKDGIEVLKKHLHALQFHLKSRTDITQGKINTELVQLQPLLNEMLEITKIVSKIIEYSHNLIERMQQRIGK